MAEPWDITSAFARQLMQDAAERDRSNTGLAMAPINQAMAMERLKEQTALELATLPKKLSIEDAVAQAREGRAFGRTKEMAAEAEQADIRKEGRGEERLPRTLKAQTAAALEGSELEREAKIKDYQKYGAEVYKGAGLAPRGAGATEGASLTPTPLPGHEVPQILPTNPYDAKIWKQDLEKLGYEITGVRAHRGHNYVDFKKKGTPTPGKPPTEPQVPNEAGKAGPLPSPTPPITPRPAANIPFDAVPEDAPLPPARPKDLLGGKDKMSFLYESIRRRGYSDDEAKAILAGMDRPEVRPTDNPDIFDVLVS